MNLKHAIQHPIFEYIKQASSEIATESFVIGGFVRDFLLERESKKDIDIVAKDSGIELALKVAHLLPTQPEVKVFKRFGTAMLRFQGMDIEFVGARKESYRSDSRNPIVEDGTLEDDQNRRDFTINAMAISLNESNFGTLIDPFGGVKHLEEKLIKTPLDPTITYSDDPLRMMRAIRFATQLNFNIEKDSFEAIKRNQERIKIISVERIMDEFNKIMLTEKPSVGLALLFESGLLDYILPEITALQGIDEIEGKTHKDNFWHTLEVVDNIAPHTQNLWLRWSALLHDVGKAPTKRYDKKIGWTFHGHEFVGNKMIPKIFKRLKLPLGNDLKYVRKIVMMSSRPISLIEDEVTDSAVRRLLFDAGDDIEDLFTLCNADITTKNPKKQRRYQNNFKRVQEKIKQVEERDRIRNFQPPITGQEIIKTFNIQPGKEIGMIKNSIKDAILAGTIPNEYEAAKAYMIQKGKQLGLEIVYE
ncbi:CCA-adding enzyme [Flavobacteriaceae bacterium UJ101]|nr:CCA-adding enzyme [Flavobacteriaceae bacterium UJ101]